MTQRGTRFGVRKFSCAVIEEGPHYSRSFAVPSELFRRTLFRTHRYEGLSESLDGRLKGSGPFVELIIVSGNTRSKSNRIISTIDADRPLFLST